MTEIEILLSVDAGRVPPMTTVFFVRDPEAPNRRLCGVLAVVAAALAVGCASTGAAHVMVALLVLTAATLAVLATPTTSDPAEAPIKRPTLVLTPEALIVRDDDGLRTWRFDDLREVKSFVLDQRLGLLIVRRDGSRDFLDHLIFERGEQLRELIVPRLPSRRRHDVRGAVPGCAL